jgi:hypothetical protein
MKRNNYLKKFFLGSAFFSLIVTGAVAQEGGDAGTAQSGSLSELVITPMRLPVLQEVGGSMFMTPDYKMATVLVNDTKVVSSVPVKFNIFNNAIMVRKDGQDMQLKFFQEVSYELTEGGEAKQYIFRTGYPEIDRNTQETIYQVLSAGPKVHLLKFLSQKVEDVNTLGDYSRREIVTTQEYYVYVPGGEIKRIKPGKKELVAALPAFSAQIDQIASAKSLKLKSESEITLLVAELNKP